MAKKDRGQIEYKELKDYGISITTFFTKEPIPELKDFLELKE